MHGNRASGDLVGTQNHRCARKCGIELYVKVVDHSVPKRCPVCPEIESGNGTKKITGRTQGPHKKEAHPEGERLSVCRIFLKLAPSAPARGEKHCRRREELC